MQIRIQQFIRFSVALAALQLSACVAYSQVLYGAIVGNITDVSSQSIPNATVLITNSRPSEFQ